LKYRAFSTDRRDRTAKDETGKTGRRG